MDIGLGVMALLVHLVADGIFGSSQATKSNELALILIAYFDPT